jgi:Flp pilus assembly protein TadB
MTRLIAIPAIVLWVGLLLVLVELRWFGRPRLVERLRPFAPVAVSGERSGGVLSVESFRDIVGPLAVELGRRSSRLLGRRDDLAARLERVHATITPTEFRTHQLGWAGAAFGATLLVVVTLGVPPLVALASLVAAPLLAFLVIEQRSISDSSAWQRRIELELPVVSEQLGMLLSSGYSLGGGLARLADRGQGACARDLALVCTRIRQGLSDLDALREWAERADVEALHRLVAILALHRQAGDLGQLIGEEAKVIRRDAHRELIESIERRAQLVWVPVTVATLLPGVLFIAVPFIEAMRLFTGD